MEHDKNLINKIATDVQTEFKMGGLTDGIYLDFATEVATRYANSLNHPSIESQLIERKHKENEECLNSLQEIVQKKIVPIDPVFVVGKLKTIDSAITYYIEKLESEIKELKNETKRH